MNLKKLSGFTLIELTVVLLVLIALAGLAIPYVSGTSQKALCDATDVSMQNIKKVIMERYYLDTLGYFPKNTKNTVANYDLKYLFTKPSDAAWQSFDIDSQTGWRGAYLESGVNVAAAPNSSFEQSSGNVHTDITGTQVLDAWGRPIIIQVFCSDSTYTTEADCKSNNETWFARLVSAGAEGSIDTSIGGDIAGDDRLLYLNQPTPTNNTNPSCAL